jgi:hypothetical protein
VLLLEGQTAPGLPFLRQLHWIITPDPVSEKAIARIFDGADGDGTNPGELWRATPLRIAASKRWRRTTAIPRSLPQQ